MLKLKNRTLMQWSHDATGILIGAYGSVDLVRNKIFKPLTDTQTGLFLKIWCEESLQRPILQNGSQKL